MKTINKQSHIPYYYQLADILRATIHESASGNSTEILPSENELLQKYQISRATVCQALSALTREGPVHKVKGKGTYIAKHRLRYPRTPPISIAEEMKRRGWEPGVEVLAAQEMEMHSPITESLGIEAGGRVYELCRLRLGNGEPVGIQWAHLPVKNCPCLLQLDLTTSLTKMMEEQFGVVYWSTHEFLRARLSIKSDEYEYESSLTRSAG
jgi:GntR family transcriptional regulator